MCIFIDTLAQWPVKCNRPGTRNTSAVRRWTISRLILLNCRAPPEFTRNSPATRPQFYVRGSICLPEVSETFVGRRLRRVFCSSAPVDVSVRPIPSTARVSAVSIISLSASLYVGRHEEAQNETAGNMRLIRVNSRRRVIKKNNGVGYEGLPQISRGEWGARCCFPIWEGSEDRVRFVPRFPRFNQNWKCVCVTYR